MPISLFEPKATRSVIADWVELSLVASGDTSISSSSVSRSEAIRGDPVHGAEFDEESGIDFELEITDAPVEAIVDDVWDELYYRQNVLGALYPFAIESRGTGWRLVRRDQGDSATQVARACYLACLLISALRTKLIPKMKRDSEYADIYASAPDVFQALSYLTSTQIIGGEAYWFGWPRITDTPTYRGALEEVVSKIGHGKLKPSDPDWSTKADKDGTVDIVAWRPFFDHRYGSAILYGQVASGANWRSKPISSYIKGHFLDWFEDSPSDKFIAAMFMPFLLHGDVRPRRGVAFEDAAIAAARRDATDFGVILDRLRLTELAHKRAQDSPHDEEIQHFGPKIYRWISKALLLSRREVVIN